ncbi:MAG: Hpt domain-containing protein, partial [Lachnospiraceae bacterium]|nr:Hpt domain-containing protein [Lachnospiraceae bacterium]
SKEKKNIRMDKEKEILPKWIFDISGLDINEGIEHCDNANDYINALTIFAASIDDKSSEIRNYLAKDNIQMYILRVHSLKSIARLVGAKELSELAAELEKAGKMGDMKLINDKTDTLLELYTSFKKPLSRLFDEVILNEDEARKILPSVSEETLNDAYMSMAEFTYCYDAGSIKMVLNALSDYKLKEEDEAKVDSIKKAVKKLDWEKLRDIFGI